MTSRAESAAVATPAFTPAPWFLTEQKRSVVARPIVTLPNGEERWTTKRICALSYNDNEADARLIAAAPELYEAVRLFVEKYGAADEPSGVAMMLAYNDALEAGKAALAKARGEAE
jgi:hypothetical protein